MTENVASLRSVKVATPPCAAKAAIPCGLAVRKQHKMLFAPASLKANKMNFMEQANRDLEGKKMAVSNIKAIFENDIHKVWDIVFAVDKYSSWRSDLSKTEIINEKQFIEYTKDGYATTFSITAVEPYRRWEFDMENSNMAGHWIGVFMAKGNKTQVDFTENVMPKKWFMKPFVKSYLRKQQKQFVLDLKKALE